MSWSEPMTVATDYLLTVLGCWWGARLWGDGARRGQRAPRLLAASFFAMALGAALGGTAHGLATTLERGALAAIWRATTITLGAAGFLLLAAAIVATLGRRGARLALALAALKLAAYVAWMTRHDEFDWVILEYGSSMLAVAALMIWAAARWRRERPAAAGWLLAAIALSAVGAAVQAGGLAPHPSFNHNDLYHVIQMLALGLFYRGGLRLSDAPAAAGAPGDGAGDAARLSPVRPPAAAP